jgi:hypothetical protein
MDARESGLLQHGICLLIAFLNVNKRSLSREGSPVLHIPQPPTVLHLQPFRFLRSLRSVGRTATSGDIVSLPDNDADRVVIPTE